MHGLETRSGRDKLPIQHEPYWKQIYPGLAVSGWRVNWLSASTANTPWIRRMISLIPMAWKYCTVNRSSPIWCTLLPKRQPMADSRPRSDLTVNHALDDSFNGVGRTVRATHTPSFALLNGISALRLAALSWKVSARGT